MRNLNRPGRQVAEIRAVSWQRRPQLLSDAVVAGYIHDISTRHVQRGSRHDWGYERVRRPARIQAAA